MYSDVHFDLIYGNLNVRDVRRGKEDTERNTKIQIKYEQRRERERETTLFVSLLSALKERYYLFLSETVQRPVPVGP